MKGMNTTSVVDYISGTTVRTLYLKDGHLDLKDGHLDLKDGHLHLPDGHLYLTDGHPT